MSKRLDALLTEWAEHQVHMMYRSGYSGVNIIEKILKDPGVSTRGSRHRVLWWPRNRRIAAVSRAMHRVSQRGQLCLIVEYGRIVREEDGQIITKGDFCRFMGISRGNYEKNIRDARNILITKIK